MADGRRWPLRGLSAHRWRCLGPRAARNRRIMACRKGARSLRPRAVAYLKLGGRQAQRANSVQNRASVAAPRHQSSGARLPTFEPTCPNPNFRRACHFFAPEHDAMIPHFLIGAPPLDSCRRSGCTWQWMAAAVRAAPPSVAGVSSTAHMFPAPPPIAAPSHAFCERAGSNLLLSCCRALSVGQRLPW